MSKMTEHDLYRMITKHCFGYFHNEGTPYVRVMFGDMESLHEEIGGIYFEEGVDVNMRKDHAVYNGKDLCEFLGFDHKKVFPLLG